MGRKYLLGALGALALGSGAQAQSMIAAPSSGSQALGRCFVLKTTGADRLLIARWLAGAMGSGSATKDLVTVNQARKTATDQGMAQLFTRLFTQDCAEQAAPLMKARDSKGVEAAGGMLGEIAMRELMSDPAVSASIFGYMKFLDFSKFGALAE